MMKLMMAMMMVVFSASMANAACSAMNSGRLSQNSNPVQKADSKDVGGKSTNNSGKR